MRDNRFSKALAVFICVSLFVVALATGSGVLKAQGVTAREAAAVDADELPDDDTYVSPTFKNLSKLYWKLGIIELNDYNAIDKYMMIHECQIYRDFYRSDIDWAHIREIARNQLAKDIGTFPTKFRYVMPMEVGRYDTTEGVFHFKNKTGASISQFHGKNRIDLNQNSIYEDVCDWQGRIPQYPRNINVVLSFPISLPHLEVDADRAAEYLRLKNTQNYGVRDVYLKLDMTLKRYQDFIANAGGGTSRYVIFGDLDAIGVYADKQLTWPLYEKSYKRKRQ